jgi:hypothetical protein
MLVRIAPSTAMTQVGDTGGRCAKEAPALDVSLLVSA